MVWFQKCLPVRGLSLAVLIIYLPENKLRNKIESKVLNDISRNPRLCYFVSFSMVSLTFLSRISESSRDLTIFIIPFSSLFEIINIIVSETLVLGYQSLGSPAPKTFFWKNCVCQCCSCCY